MMISSQKQLAIFLPYLIGGGAQRIALNLAQGIAGRGYKVDLVVARAEGSFLNQVPVSVRLVDLNAKRVLRSLPDLVRYLQRERPYAMLSVMNYANIIALWAKRLGNVPTRMVVSEHTTLSQEVRHTSDSRMKLMPFFVTHLYPWADEIVAVSKGMADDLYQTTNIPKERIQVIYNPVVVPGLREKAQAVLEHPWFKPGEPPVLLAVGRLSKQKDFVTLIRAFSLVRQTRSARLLILGEGDERPELESLVRQLHLEQDVGLPGFEDNPYAYMAQAALFVLSSRWEGLPTVLIEALYCGAPLISTDCPCGAREILRDGEYGQLVPVGDIKMLAQAIGIKLETPSAQPPKVSWLPFEMETVVNQYLKVLLGNKTCV